MQSIAGGNGESESGDPCTAARATFIIPNPCPAYNTTVNTTVGMRPVSRLLQATLHQAVAASRPP